MFYEIVENLFQYGCNEIEEYEKTTAFLSSLDSKSKRILFTAVANRWIKEADNKKNE